MTAIQWISKEAKAIRKKHPKLEWSQCIKKASALYNSKHKTGSKPKKVGSVAKPKKTTTSKTHKDTKSHNVNIRVVSGVKDWQLPNLVKHRDYLENVLIGINNNLKFYQNKQNTKDLAPSVISNEKKYYTKQKKDIVEALKSANKSINSFLK